MAGEKLTYRIARSKQDLVKAYSLVFREYAKKRYVDIRHYKSRMKVSLMNALPSTTTFIAEQGNRVVATVTLIPDSPLGLPMDKLYEKEVNRRRAQGWRIAEVGQLAIDSRIFERSMFSMFNFDKLIFLFRLFKLLLDYAITIDHIDEFCIAINPKQEYLYRFLGFKELGPLKYYGFVNNAPAIAKFLSLDESRKHAAVRRALNKIFWGSVTAKSAFRGKYAMTARDLDYFFKKKSDVFEKASKNQLRYIKQCYPRHGSDSIIRP